MKNMFAIAAVALTLTACGPGFQGDIGPTGPTGPTGPAAPIPTPAPTPTVDVVQQDINYLVDDENSYRLGQGQAILSAGLSCQVAEIVSGAYLSGSNGAPVISTSGKPTYNYLYKGSFNQPDSVSGVSNLLPSSIRNLYVGKNYRIICSGQIVVRDTDYYQFETKSDDGSLLLLDGASVVTNDGNHGFNVTALTGSKFLRRGIHTIQVQYAQSGGGNFGFVLTSGNASIDPRFYYH